MPKVITICDEYVDDANEMHHDVLAKITIEHSLLSMSKWEAKYHKAYMDTTMTSEETLDYIIMMIVEPKDFDLRLLSKLSKENFDEIKAYISDPQTATTFNEDAINAAIGEKKPKKKEKITSELVYYWMAAAGIPFECENWPINRLLTLIRIYDIKNQPEKKMSKSEILRRNKALNDARRKKLGTKG